MSKQNAAAASDAESWHKEEFSRAYLLAVATRGGFTLAVWNVDKDGVDATLRRGGLMVDIQLKCTRSPRGGNDYYTYDLDVPTYDKLRDAQRSAPGYMALMIVPQDINLWLMHEPEKLLMSCHAYWARLQDEAAPRGVRTTAVKIPRTQQLNTSALEQMFKDSLNRLTSGIKRGAAA